MVIVAVLKELHAGRENSWGREVKQNLLLAVWSFKCVFVAVTFEKLK